MSKSEDETAHNLKVLEALDNAIENGPWDYNLFFKATGKKLIEIRERFKRDFNLGSVEDSALPATLADRVAKRSGLVEVFISLYNADGSNIRNWESTINSIRSYAVNRPIYRGEREAKTALRAASNQQNEGYIAIYMLQEEILKSEQDYIPKDRWGNELLVVNEGAVSPKNITRFVHISGTYSYKDGRLIRQGVTEPL